MFKFFVCVLFVLITGCSEPKTIEGRIDNVVRVFWHQYAKYSVLVDLGNNTHQMRDLPYYVCEGNHNEVVSIISDVATTNKMWVSWKLKTSSGGGSCLREMSIHVHTPKDIGEGSWTCGKSTCQTSVIE